MTSPSPSAVPFPPPLPAYSRWQLWVFSALLIVLGLTLFTRENQFKFYYHPDEPVKGLQVQTAHWNFHHPMLMLGTARLALKASGEMENRQHVVEVGRWISAGFAAGSVALLAAMAWITAGRFAGVATGLLLITNHQLFELAHYFKEDTALLFGLSAWFLALTLYWRRPHWTTAALVGVGAALAVSGKYLGAFCPLLSLWLVPWHSKQQRFAMLAVFVSAFAAVFALVNLPLILSYGSFESSFHREMALVIHGQSGMTRSVPHTVYLNAFRDNIAFVLWPFLILRLGACWRRRGELTAVEGIAALFPILFLLVLSFSPKSNDRYFLPATAFFLCAIALGLDQLRARWPSARVAPAILAILVLCQIGGLPKHDLWSYYRAFQTDDRADLAAWLNINLPHATLAQDRSVKLPVPAITELLPYQPRLSPTMVQPSVEKIADLAAFRKASVTHVILSANDFGRYNLESLRPQKGAEAVHVKSRDLYRVLRAQKPLWERPRDTVIYLHPGLEVYELPAE